MKKTTRRIISMLLIMAMVCSLSMVFAGAAEILDNTTSEVEVASARGIYKCMVTANGVRVRSGPGTEYAILGQMDWGDIVYKYSVTGDWAYVLCGAPNTGLYGYIHTDYLIEVDDF